MMGGGAFEGDMAYGAVDLGLSAYGVGRMVLKPDAWRLFRRPPASIRGSEFIGDGQSDDKEISPVLLTNEPLPRPT